jgi:uncharacterized protein YjiS (DUF1127 family)
MNGDLEAPTWPGNLIFSPPVQLYHAPARQGASDAPDCILTVSDCPLPRGSDSQTKDYIMTTIDHETMPLAVAGAQSPRFRMLQKIGELVAALGKAHQRRRAYQQLSTLDAHLLRDIGLNPDDLRDAFENRTTSLLFEPVRLPSSRD